MDKAQPTFLGIGAQKAGTSWLHHELGKHPQIWLPPLKEIHFFDRSTYFDGSAKLAISIPLRRFLGTDRIASPGAKSALQTISNHVDDDWYRGLFSYAASFQERGEITPSYSILESSDVMQIKAINPDMKLLFMVRNPIDRAFSSVRYNVGKGKLNTNLNSDDEVITSLKKSSTVKRGDYEQTIATYLEHFDASQFLLCFYDAIQQDPSGLMSGITDLLGVESFKQDSVNPKRRINASPAHKMSDRVFEFLREHYAPMINRMADRFGSYAVAWRNSIDPTLASSKKGKTTIASFPAVIHP